MPPPGFDPRSLQVASRLGRYCGSESVFDTTIVSMEAEYETAPGLPSDIITFDLG